MQLLDLPVEILTLIFTSRKPLSLSDLCSLLQCSRFLHGVVLPILYRNVEFSLRGQNSTKNVDSCEMIDVFISKLEEHPERKPWVSDIVLRWTGCNNHYRHRIDEVLSLLPRLQTMSLKELCIQHRKWPDARHVHPACCLTTIGAFNSLRALVLDNRYTTIADIVHVLALPALQDLTLVEFKLGTKNDEVSCGMSDIGKPHGAPATKRLRKLTFLKSLVPDPEVFGGIFPPEILVDQLTWHLVAESSPAQLQLCLYHLRHSLTRLQLTWGQRHPAIERPKEPMDFSEFPYLVTVEIHSALILSPCPENPPGDIDRGSERTSLNTMLANRMPRALKSLHIRFGTPHCAFKSSPEADFDCSWIRALVDNCIQLTTLKITEELSPALCKHDQDIQKWLPPLGLLEICGERGITLDVLLRVKPRYVWPSPPWQVCCRIKKDIRAWERRDARNAMLRNLPESDIEY